MTEPFNKDAVIAKNPQIQQERVEEYLAYEKARRDEGGLDARHYEVTAPLGRLVRSDQQTTSSISRIQRPK